MDPKKDKEFLYLAREGLKAPVSKPWRACQTKNGEIYYFNFESGESQWDHPSDDIYRKKFHDAKYQVQIAPEPSDSNILRETDQNALQTSTVSNDDDTSKEMQLNNDQSLDQNNKENFDSDKSFKHSFLDEAQLSLDNDETEKQDLTLSQNPFHGELGEHYSEQNQSVVIREDHHNLSSIKKDGGLILGDEGLPETKNFYDDVSLNNESMIRIDENNEADVAGTYEMEGVSVSAHDDTMNHAEHEKQDGSLEKDEKQDESLDKDEKMFYEGSDVLLSKESLYLTKNIHGSGPFTLEDELKWGEKDDRSRNEEPERGYQSQITQSDRNKDSMKKKVNETVSLCFSDFKQGESEKKNEQEDAVNANVVEFEVDYEQALKQYDEELREKFSEALGEYEQEFHNEALKIEKEYETEMNEINNYSEKKFFKDENGMSEEKDVSNMKRQLTERYEQELLKDIESLKFNFERMKSELEKEEEENVENSIQQLKREKEAELDDIEEVKQKAF